MPERFYAFEPPLTKTAKALADGREVVIVVLGGSSTLGLAAGGPLRLARTPGCGACREVPVRAHQGGQPRRCTPDGEAGGRAPGSRCPSPEADPCDLGDRHNGGGSRSDIDAVPGDDAGRD